MIILVGSGLMGVEYAKVLKALGHEFTVIGRGEANATIFKEKTGVPVLTGGLDAAISEGLVAGARSAIVSVTVEALFDTSIALLQQGVRHLLIEKPGVMEPSLVHRLRNAVHKAGAQAYIAYNRRFYSSVRRAREIILADGGLTSFTFDFTEWSHEIATLDRAPGVKDYWVLANSSHVLDLAFHLGGKPAELHATRAGALGWHPSGAVFVGSGLTEAGTPFSYHADWGAPGRWGLEFCTSEHKLIFRPLEKLHVMRRGSVHLEEAVTDPEDARLDLEFKPGFYRQVEAFLASNSGVLCTVDELAINFGYYCAVAGYKQVEVRGI